MRITAHLQKVKLRHILAVIAGTFGLTIALPLAAEAATASTTVSSAIGSTISISSSGTVNVNVTPTGAGAQTIEADTVSVSTNDSSGYTLQIAETGASGSLTSGSNTIAGVSGSQTTPVVETAGTWGYRVDGVGGFGSGPTSAASNQAISSTIKFAAVPATASPNTIKTTATAASNDSTSVWYGVAANTSQASGTYTNSVTYTATGN